jgi:pimeloyl-ACP methyl ester carboxylesterase
MDLDFTLPLHMQGGDIGEASRGLEADGFFVPGTGKRAAAKYHRLMTQTSAAQDFKRYADLDLPALSKLTCPTFAVYGSASPFLPTLQGLRAAIPDFHWEIVDQGGHNFPFTFPEHTAEAIRRFWDDIAVGGTDRTKRCVVA